MELRQLGYFVAIAEEEHFGRAAKRLGVTQPALSRQIQHLEDALHVQLFERLPRGVRLTAAGRALLVDARELLASVGRAVDRARRVEAGEMGQLRVAYVDAMLGGPVLTPVLRTFREAYAGVGLEVVLLPTLEQWDALRDGRIDIGFAFDRPPEPEVEGIVAARERVLLALPDDHPLAKRPTLGLRDLVDEPFVMQPRAVSPRYYDLVTEACAGGGLRMEVRYEVTSFFGVLGLVAAGLGVGWALESVLHPPKGVALRPVDDFHLDLQTHVMWRRDHLGATGRAFLGTLRRWLGPSDGQEGLVHGSARSRS